MKLSVIVPVYNAAKYLEQCLGSIINQTYKDLEILIINDGSTDNSLEICEKFALSDGRIKIFDIPNGGVSNARNLGLDSATGEYIAFVDSDDYINPTMYEKLMSAIIAENTDGAVCQYYIDKDGKLLPPPVVDDTHIDLAFGKRQLAEFTWSHSTFGRVPSYIWRTVYKRSCISLLRFDTSMSFGEDTMFLLNAIKNSTSFACVDEGLYYYRFPTSSKGTSLSLAPEIDRAFIFADKMADFYKDIGLDTVAESVYFEFYIDIISRSTHNKLSLKNLDKYTKIKLKQYNKRAYYFAYIHGSISLKLRIRAFLVHYKQHWLLKIAQKLRNKA